MRLDLINADKEQVIKVLIPKLIILIIIIILDWISGYNRLLIFLYILLLNILKFTLLYILFI